MVVKKSIINKTSEQWIEVTQKIKLPDPPGKIDLVYEDGIPMESDWHRNAMNLLIEVISQLWRDRKDYFVGGNMFIYFDPNQVKRRNFRGPDFFVVKDIEDNTHWRDAWVLWEEDWKVPDIVIELTSKSTEAEDRGPKKDIYEHILQVPDYICYNPETKALFGWRLVNGQYQELLPNDRGWLWCESLGLWIGTWEGTYLGRRIGTWPRFFDQEGNLMLMGREVEAEQAFLAAERAKAEAERAEAEAERAEAEAERAEAEAERAEAEAEARRVAEAEVERLGALLKQQGTESGSDNAPH